MKRERARRSYHSPLRQEQALATRERILDAAEKHLASDPDEVSFPRIARIAGVSVPTVHRQFPDRRALYEGLVERTDQKFRGIPEPTTVEELIAAGPGYVARWAAISPLEAALNRSRAAQKARQEFGHPEKRAWLARLFERELAGLDRAEAQRFQDALMFLTAAGSVQVLAQSIGLSVSRSSAVLTLLMELLSAHARERPKGRKPGQRRASKRTTQGNAK